MAESDRQTDRQTDRQAGRQTDRQTDRVGTSRRWVAEFVAAEDELCATC